MSENPHETLLLETLLEQAQAIRPDVRYVSVTHFAGNYYLKNEYWAFATNVAFTGETPNELMQDLIESIAGKVVAA